MVTEHPTGGNARRLVDQISELDLAQHIVELEAFGYTVVPPETVALTPELVAELRDTVVRVHGRRHGVEVGDPGLANLPGEQLSRGDGWWLLEEPGIVDTLKNPVLRTLASWLVGNSGVLSGSVYVLRSAAGSGFNLALHTDTHGVPCPTGPVAHTANTSILLSDYEDDSDGPTVVVPGSHRFGRVPVGAEQQFWSPDYPHAVVPIRGKAGSVAVWHGNTWHGALPRTKPGLRMSLVHYWARSYMRPINDYRGAVPEALLEREPDLARVLGLEHCYPWREAPHDPLAMVALVERGGDPFD